MGMRLAYLAHPVSPETGESVESNLADAKRCLKSLAELYPDICFIAPWIVECQIWDDCDPEHRSSGLKRCHVVIARCDELWMCGPRISSGMAGELAVAREHGLRIVQLVLS